MAVFLENLNLDLCRYGLTKNPGEERRLSNLLGKYIKREESKVKHKDRKITKTKFI